MITNATKLKQQTKPHKRATGENKKTQVQVLDILCIFYYSFSI